ncbi:MAG: serine/threonine protein kinase [Cyanobacteria bacterium HKST-UBA02]|nr:serine/threonine protein kinase [Cyanobacteria bacterium HKST-UBA02]
MELFDPDEFFNQQEIAGRYQLKEKLGEGGLGVVYSVHDRTLDRIVAIKVLKAEVSEELAVRFQREAKAAARLQQANILQVLDFGVAGNYLYLVMELVEGRSLADLIEERQFLEWKEAAPLFVQICDGMANAHYNGIYHRDLKPSNIMLVDGEDGETLVKIVDFGLAKSAEGDQSLTREGAGIGSPLYMSPEQAEGKNVDERADIYSMGCLMYETLAGEPPFMGATAVETIMKQVSEAPVPLSEKSGRTFPDAVEDCVRTCIQKEPSKRFKHFGLLKDAIEAVPIQAPETRSESSFIPESASNTKPRIIAIATTILAALFCFFAYNLMTSDAPEVVPKKENSPQDPFVNPISEKIEGDPKTVAKRLFDVRDLETGVRVKGGMGTINDQNLELLLAHPDMSGVESIRNLDVKRTMITGETFDRLQGLAISEVRVGYCPLTDKGLAVIARSKGLRQLYLENNDSLSKDALKGLGQCPSLLYLEVSGKQLDDCSITDLGALKHLLYLKFIELKLGKSALKTVSGLPRLATINFRKCEFAPGSLSFLSRCKNLERVTFELSVLDAGTLTDLLKIPVKSILLDRTEVEPGVDLLDLAKVPGLEEVDIAQCKGVTRAMLVALRKAGLRVKFKPLITREDKDPFGLEELSKSKMLGPQE